MEGTGNHEQQVDYVALKVTAGILVHIGAGIYNSVAGAIKELVSNSFDADATSVTISTDYPYFNEIKVVDNGLGMSKQRLRQAMQSIGSSLKDSIDPSRNTKEYNRPIIGHLGIGLMALSQVCKKAVIESQEPGVDIKFVAELDFTQFKDREEEQMTQAKLEVLMERYGGLDVMKDIIENPETDEEMLAEVEVDYEIAIMAHERLEEVKKKRPDVELEGEHLGYCAIYPNLPAIPGESGTTITLKDIDKEVKDQLKDEIRDSIIIPDKYQNMDNPWDRYRDDVNFWSWNEICERLQLGTSNLTFSVLPGYHQFLWELSLMTPIQYLPDGPVLFDKSILQSKKQELRAYKFILTVDNHKLYKPILLPSGNIGRIAKAKKEWDYNIRFLKYAGEIDGDPLNYHGYIYWQREQNKPDMIQGLQIYIRNVGIGLYDKTLLNYSKVNPSSRIPQTSGEIYVEEGLERALSIDRNSFRDTDAHYMFLRNQIYDLLGTYKREGSGLFGASVDAYYKRRDKKDADKMREHIDELDTIVNKVSEKEISVKLLEYESDNPYILKKNEVIVNKGSPYWPKAAKERMLYQKILIPVKVAVENGATAQEVLELLEKLLLGIGGEENAK